MSTWLEAVRRVVGRVRVKNSYVMAGVFAVLLLGWLYSGQLGRGDGPPGAGSAEAAADAALVGVRARVLEAQPRVADLVARGRTEAIRAVALAAETEATVIALPFERGARVRQGDVICQLAPDGRDTRLAEAQALRTQRALEYEAARKLRAKEFRSEVQQAHPRVASNGPHVPTRIRDQAIRYESLQALHVHRVGLVLAPIEGQDPTECGDPNPTIG